MTIRNRRPNETCGRGRPANARLEHALSGSQSADPGAFLDDEVSAQIRKLLVSQCRRRRWLTTLLDDALQEVESLIQEAGVGPIRHKFARQYFGDADYLTVKHAVFRAIDKVIDKFRGRHKLEVKTDSVWFDPAKAKPGQRQRRELPGDVLLGPDDRCLPDDRNSGIELSDLHLDLDSALQTVGEEARQVIVKKVVFDQTWESVAEDLGMPVSRAKALYKQTLSHLTERLRGYEGPAAPVARDLRATTPA